MTDSQLTSDHTFQFSPGSIISKYQIIEPYAHGAFKEVYRVERYAQLPLTEDETELKDGLLTLVLKVFKRPAEITSPSSVQNLEWIAEHTATDTTDHVGFYDDARVRKFLKELDSYRELQKKKCHKNIAKLIDSGIFYDKDKPEPAKLYFVEEYVEGDTLSQMISKLQPNADGLRQLPVELASSIFSQVADGVKYLHQNKVAHRDIKGSNIIVRPSGEAVLTDFGNARIVTAEEYMQHGNILYRSPEELIGESGGTPSDMWAMGVLMYEALTGKYPFETSMPDWSGLTPEQKRQEMEQIKRNIAFNKVSPIREYNREVPKAISRLVLRALKRHPSERIGAKRFCANLAREYKALTGK